ncbi:MAG: holo-ACP synthase [Deferribacteraceae bacterium]|jgi:holo-[acyl-carrier protein] synthase|nr:holo-ACP synthase [Deferribacteraceae bacterium]
MIGCDIISIERVAKIYVKYGDNFLRHILTQAETALFYKRASSMAFLAGRFAAKEAVAKAYRTGLGYIGFTDIEVLPDKNGAPQITVRGISVPGLEISISHCREYAIAVCRG